MRKTDGSLWSATQETRTGGEWSDTTLTRGIAADPDVIRDADDRLTYLVRKADGSLWQGRQDVPLGASWQDHVVVPVGSAAGDGGDPRRWS